MAGFSYTDVFFHKQKTSKKTIGTDEKQETHNRSNVHCLCRTGRRTIPTLPKPEPYSGATCRRPAQAPHTRREDKTDDERFAGHTPTGHTAIRMVERGSARHWPQRLRNSLPHNNVHGRIVGRDTARTGFHHCKRRGPCESTTGQTQR